MSTVHRSAAETATDRPAAAAHTPGPWYIGGSLVSNGNEAVARILRRPVVHRDKLRESPDTETSAPKNGTTSDANARLIAAAPDLLAACEAALLPVERSDVQSGPKGRDRDLAAMLRAAISKALGESK